MIIFEALICSHRTDKVTFLTLIRTQLSRTLDLHFKLCGRQGSHGVPFRATLASYAYTDVAECTPLDFGVCQTAIRKRDGSLKVLHGHAAVRARKKNPSDWEMFAYLIKVGLREQDNYSRRPANTGPVERPGKGFWDGIEGGSRRIFPAYDKRSHRAKRRDFQDIHEYQRPLAEQQCIGTHAKSARLENGRSIRARG